MSGKMLRTVSMLALAVGLLVAYSSAASAAPAGISASITLSGKPLPVNGVIMYENAMVPLDSLAHFGMKIDSTYESRLLISRGSYRVDLGVGSTTAIVNGHEIRGVVAPVKEDGQVMLPLRFLFENMGYDVVWQGGPQNTVDIRPVTVNNITIGTMRERQETATLSLDVQYPKVSGLAAAVQDKINAYFADRTNTPKASAHEAEKQNIEAGQLERPTQLFCNYLIRYNRNGLLSLTLDDYVYSGGAHGGTVRTGYTVDLSSGKTYALKDLFAPGTDYVALLSKEVAKQIVDQELKTLVDFTAIRPDQDFYLSGDSLVVYFQQYELMPYAWGFPEFRIPLASVKNVLVPELAGVSQ